jgi:hypothetical protein
VSEEAALAGLIARISTQAAPLDLAFDNARITGGAHRIEDYPSANAQPVPNQRNTSQDV